MRTVRDYLLRIHLIIQMGEVVRIYTIWKTVHGFSNKRGITQLVVDKGLRMVCV